MITFCVCLELLQSRATRTAFASFLLAFSLLSSVGIGIGLAVSELGGQGSTQMSRQSCLTEMLGCPPVWHGIESWSDGRLPGAVLQGLAAGTILYVVMFEVLSRERERDGPGLVPLAGLCLGFTAMLLLEMFGEA